VITLDVASMSEGELRRELLGLRNRHARLLAILRLLVVLVKVLEVSGGHENGSIQRSRDLESERRHATRSSGSS
jgi:hypothetical protein